MRISTFLQYHTKLKTNSPYSRCLTGLLNGNIGKKNHRRHSPQESKRALHHFLGVMKSTIGDLTDSSNRAEGVSMLPVVWSLGATIG